MDQRRSKKRTNDGSDQSSNNKRARNDGSRTRRKKKADSIRKSLRVVQQETSCSTKTLLTAIKILMPFFEDVDDIPMSFKRTDNDLTKKGCRFLKLHGCVGCNNHVFLPSDKVVRCPRCRFPRFNVSGEPNEVSVVFAQVHNTQAILIPTLTCRYVG